MIEEHMNKVGITINATRKTTTGTGTRDNLSHVLIRLTLNYYSSSSHGLYFNKYKRISIFERKHFYSKIKCEIGQKLKKITMNRFLKKHGIMHTVEDMLDYDELIAKRDELSKRNENLWNSSAFARNCNNQIRQDMYRNFLAMCDLVKKIMRNDACM